MKVSELIQKLQSLTDEQKELDVCSDEFFPNRTILYIEEDDIRRGVRGIVLHVYEE